MQEALTRTWLPNGSRNGGEKGDISVDQAGTGRIIQALRRERGLTQEALAGMLGVSAAAVSKWETGVSLS